MGAVGLAGLTALAGCSGRAATGTLAKKVKDAPGSDFESYVVTIERFWLTESDGDDSDSDGDNGVTDGARFSHRRATIRRSQ